MVPPEQVNHFVDVRPEECGGCEGPLVARADEPEPLRQQQVELPPIKPEVTEYRLHSGYCARCGRWTCASLPAGVADSAFGPHLSVVMALLTGRYRLSKRLAQDLMETVLGIELSLGSVSNVEQRVSAALAQPVEEAKAFVREQRVAHLDETGWRERLKKAWLWVAVTASVTIFVISKSRGAAVAKQILGEDFAGFLVTDRWSAYRWTDLNLHQVCWSHLERDFQSFVDRGGEGAPIGRALLKQSKKMFRWWRRVRDGTLKRQTFERRMRFVEKEVGRLLRKASVCSSTKTAGMAKEMLKVEMAFWTFVTVEGVEPTNNAAERAIRPAVIWRKGSFGTHSEEGSRFVERMLTTVTTLRQQKRNVLEYLTAAYSAHLLGLAPPSLLPVDSLHPQLLAA